jgi:hypothetical protein
MEHMFPRRAAAGAVLSVGQPERSLRDGAVHQLLLFLRHICSDNGDPKSSLDCGLRLIYCDNSTNGSAVPNVRASFPRGE